jgi:Flp pilus assembly protein TadG
MGEGPVDDRGAVTVEAAIAVCALVAVFGLVLAGMAAVVDQMRCTDAATLAARALARGTPDSTVEQLVHMTAPEGATTSVERVEGAVVVRVSVRPVGGLLPGVVVRAEARAELEPGVGEEVDDGSP